MARRISSTITLAAVDALQPGDIINDTKIRGFVARRQKDAVSYALKTRVDGKQRWFTIGRHGQPWTPETARKRALAILADPSKGEKPKVAPAGNAFAEVAERFFDVHGVKLKPRTLDEYRRLNRLYLTPAFGTMPINAITRAVVRQAHVSWKSNPRAANHALAVLSKLMSWAEDEEQAYRSEGTNPCRRIERFAENKRERFLTEAELARLGQALDKAEAGNSVGSFAIAALRLLILTGARLNEILTLQWSFIDFDRCMIFLPDSKTGQKPITLNAAAIALLQKLPRFANNPYVIVGNRHGGHLINLQKEVAPQFRTVG